MPIKSILCAYSGEHTKAASLHHAVKMARYHGADLHGALVHGRPVIERKYRAHLPENILDTIRETDESHVADVRQRFVDIVTAAGLPVEDRFVELDPERGGRLSQVARGYDILVTGVHSKQPSDMHLSTHPDLIALRSGRPVLVVPDGYKADVLAERAVVAWDGKRAATRAIGDAIDILADKAQVTLISVAETPPYTDRMLANMRAHGVTVGAETVPKDGSVANTLIAAAARHQARLIVMGAFEHSKFSHDLFGGVTTDVIDAARVPVLLAH